MAGSGSGNTSKDSKDTKGTKVTADTKAIRALAKTLTDSLANDVLFTGLLNLAEAPFDNGGLNMVNPLGDAQKDADARHGLMPGYVSYFTTALQLKGKVDTQVTWLMNSVSAKEIGGGSGGSGGSGAKVPRIYDMIQSLADGLVKAADAYDKNEQVSATDMLGFENALGVASPPPQMPTL